MQFASDVTAGDVILAPLAPPGQAPAPAPVGGSLDLNVTKGKLSRTAWKLDFRTTNTMSGNVTYTADGDGWVELTGTLNYSDGNARYKSTVPPLRIRVQKCDYRLKITLRENRTISGMSGEGIIILTGEGGFRINHDQLNARGNKPFSGKGSTEVTVAPAQFAGDEERGYMSGAISGRGTLNIEGELVQDGTMLDMFVVLNNVSMSGTQRVGQDPEGSRSFAFTPGQYAPMVKCLDSLQLPHTGGTKSCSESYTMGGCCGGQPHRRNHSVVGGCQVKYWTSFFTLSLLAVLLGCSSSPAAAPVSGVAATPSAARVAPTSPAGVAASANTAGPATAIAKVAPTPAGDPIAFPDPRGLDTLDSYLLVLRLSFKGMRDGQAIETTDIYTRTVSRDPAAQFTTIQTTDPDGKPLRLLYGSIGQVRYTQGGADRPCTLRWDNAGTAGDAPNLAQMLKPARRGKEAGRETVNGVPARHYVLAASSFDPVAQANVSGDLWIAEPGNYVIKYLVRIQGDETYFGKGVQGEQTTAFEVTDVDAKKPVTPPAGCPPPFSDLPAMADADKLVRTPWGFSYSTASGLDKTVAFYKDQMKALGWALESASGASSNRHFMSFSLAKEKKHAYITLTVAGAAVQVEARVQSD